MEYIHINVQNSVKYDIFIIFLLYYLLFLMNYEPLFFKLSSKYEPSPFMSGLD